MKIKWILSFTILSIFILTSCSYQSQEKQQSTDHSKIVPQQIKFTKTPLPKKVDRIVIVIEENHSLQSIAGNRKAPYMNYLMNNGANLTNYRAIEHPSQPNYLDIFSGSNQGVTSDRMPNRKFSTSNLASELVDKKYTFVGYSENLPSIGFKGETDSQKLYARKHNPWVNFTNVPKNDNQPFSNFPKDYSKLPTVSFVIPNLNNDMHDGTIKQADMWLKKNIDPYVEWAKKNNSLLIVTFDEDDGSQSNIVPTFFVGPMIKKGTYDTPVNHFSLLRTIEDLYGLAHAGKSKTTSPISNIWK
ncbi:acid phosphatase [Bacillus sp. RG28]|uniref:Acid phosphatase n=1 Tax=Gottfriedia endophytica TaxID=2820819 RepID=A0A940NPL2_9BACI|nr:alkaline phosphatase family protein [Gottfriedia endophytica]MBP0726441.1 acid phosphatase [Gottfriedia endophytica]